MTSILALPGMPVPGLNSIRHGLASSGADRRAPVPCLGVALALSTGLWLPLFYAASRLLT